MVFNTEEVVFNKFLDDFKSIFFYRNRQHRAEVALSIFQTGTVWAYTKDFNSHACTVGWANAPLMSLYQHGLKENSRGNEQHPFHLPPDYAGNGPEAESRPYN
ncbi:uncharacterized protein VP01_14096g1 [Puccinia sorghi]|uniref:Retrotransposon gag domain-containing protein n=1 Tax=Puccinia sorghi TaxID=27349 RepID=A0A0L6VKV1_9BASI|nr:uncharacterized protein VP01_14096g1 [Puccinia sorghi]